jgi:uncharacterized phage-associated protein
MTDAPVQLHAAQAPPYAAGTIAKWFIAWAEAEGEEISNLKLQKLLYYAQGHHFGQQHKPLFPDPIQAWSHGPVVPDVYHAYKGAGSASIILPDEDPFTWDDIDPETSEFLSTVWNTYGGYSAGRLRNMTHEEPPWRNHFRDDARHIIIPQSEIEQYFAARHPS